MDYKEAFSTLVSRMIFRTASQEDLQKLVTEEIINILEKIDDQKGVIEFVAETLLTVIDVDMFMSNPYRTYTISERAQIKLIDFLKKKALESVKVSRKSNDPSKTRKVKAF